eukprot:6199579-Pleurochrysis_carterae.AAC.6
MAAQQPYCPPSGRPTSAATCTPAHGSSHKGTTSRLYFSLYADIVIEKLHNICTYDWHVKLTQLALGWRA